ncbi:hypothetical protein ACSQ67_003978 [Phaseolus vulgaris]
MGSTENDLSLAEEALLQDEERKLYTGDGSVDFKGRPVLKKSTGNWKACPFILGNECCERLAYYGIATNLVTYLTQKLHQGNVSAARNVTTWQGTCYLTPLIGAVLADAYWGRYWTIAVFSMIYVIGMGTLTLSASVPVFKPAECLGASCPPATPAQYALFFFERTTLPGLLLMRCLDRAAVVSDAESKTGDYSNKWRICSVTQVEELKILIRMFPIWSTGIVFAAVYAQMSTLFVEQGTMMKTNLGSFRIPPASLSSFDLAEELDLVDQPVPVPLNIFWQVPQYFLLGAAEVFTFVGQLEFFYDQSPDAMRSLCSALSLLTTSLGSYLSSFILTVVTYFTTKGGNPGWIPDNLNEGHLDYFFWLLAGLSFLNMFVYVVAAKRYKQKRSA